MGISTNLNPAKPQMVFDKKARETRIELGMEGVQGRKIRTLCQLLV